jgi:hypothetical protein
MLSRFPHGEKLSGATKEAPKAARCIYIMRSVETLVQGPSEGSCSGDSPRWGSKTTAAPPAHDRHPIGPDSLVAQLSEARWLKARRPAVASSTRALGTLVFRSCVPTPTPPRESVQNPSWKWRRSVDT